MATNPLQGDIGQIGQPSQDWTYAKVITEAVWRFVREVAAPRRHDLLENAVKYTRELLSVRARYVRAKSPLRQWTVLGIMPGLIRKKTSQMRGRYWDVYLKGMEEQYVLMPEADTQSPLTCLPLPRDVNNVFCAVFVWRGVPRVFVITNRGIDTKEALVGGYPNKLLNPEGLGPAFVITDDGIENQDERSLSDVTPLEEEPVRVAKRPAPPTPQAPAAKRARREQQELPPPTAIFTEPVLAVTQVVEPDPTGWEGIWDAESSSGEESDVDPTPLPSVGPIPWNEMLEMEPAGLPLVIPRLPPSPNRQRMARELLARGRAMFEAPEPLPVQLPVAPPPPEPVAIVAAAPLPIAVPPPPLEPVPLPRPVPALPLPANAAPPPPVLHIPEGPLEGPSTFIQHQLETRVGLPFSLVQEITELGGTSLPALRCFPRLPQYAALPPLYRASLDEFLGLEDA